MCGYLCCGKGILYMRREGIFLNAKITSRRTWCSSRSVSMRSASHVGSKGRSNCSVVIGAKDNFSVLNLHDTLSNFLFFMVLNSTLSICCLIEQKKLFLFSILLRCPVTITLSQGKKNVLVLFILLQVYHVTTGDVIFTSRCGFQQISVWNIHTIRYPWALD